MSNQLPNPSHSRGGVSAGARVPLSVLQQQSTLASRNALNEMIEEVKRKDAERIAANRLAQEKEALEERQRLGNNDSNRGGSWSSTYNNRTLKTAHAVTAAQNLDESTISHKVEFQVFGSLDQVQMGNPLVRDELGKLKWTQFYTEDVNRTTKPSSPWRKAFHERGPMQPFMKEGTSATSKAVHCGTKLLSVTNSYPFPVGLFMIGSRVSRSPEDSLWAEKVEEIMAAFYVNQDTLSDTKRSSIAFVRAIPPNQTLSLDSDVVFHAEDCDNRPEDDANTNTQGFSSSQERGQQEQSVSKAPEVNNWAKQWINVTKESMRSSIMIDEFNPGLMVGGDGGAFEADKASRSGSSTVVPPEMVQSLIKAKSPLARFIFKHWDVILQKATGEESNTAMNYQFWIIPSHFLNKNDNRSPEERAKNPIRLEVHPVLKIVVDTALAMIDEILDNLPFARLSEHQFFLARLDSDSFKCTEGSVTPASSIEAHLEVPIVCAFTATFEFWFKVVSVTQKRQLGATQEQEVLTSYQEGGEKQ